MGETREWGTLPKSRVAKSSSEDERHENLSEIAAQVYKEIAYQRKLRGAQVIKREVRGATRYR